MVFKQNITPKGVLGKETDKHFLFSTNHYRLIHFFEIILVENTNVQKNYFVITRFWKKTEYKEIQNK
jgi:hypothetical protein